jgi:hypothetical protein
MSAKTKIIAWLTILATVGLTSGYVLEFHWLGNTFEAGKLAAYSTLAALLLGAFLGWKFHKKGEEQVDKIRIWAACLIIPTVFAPLLGSWSNRLLSPYPSGQRQFEFFEEKPYAQSRFGFIEGETITPDGYYVFVFYNNELQRIRSKDPLFQGKQRGEMVELPVRKGLWGFETVLVK